jgi:hypothetical protein
MPQRNWEPTRCAKRSVFRCRLTVLRSFALARPNGQIAGSEGRLSVTLRRSQATAVTRLPPVRGVGRPPRPNFGDRSGQLDDATFLTAWGMRRSQTPYELSGLLALNR